MDIVSSHFRKQIEDEMADKITLFQGRFNQLGNPITHEEVRRSFNSLSNNSALDKDQIRT